MRRSWRRTRRTLDFVFFFSHSFWTLLNLQRTKSEWQGLVKKRELKTKKNRPKCEMRCSGFETGRVPPSKGRQELRENGHVTCVETIVGHVNVSRISSGPILHVKCSTLQHALLQFSFLTWTLLREIRIKQYVTSRPFLFTLATISPSLNRQELTCTVDRIIISKGPSYWSRGNNIWIEFKSEAAKSL